MLHGDIRVNGQAIAAWTARRLDELTDQTQVSSYECSYQTLDGLIRISHAAFVVRHRYDAGAAALASEVMRRGAGYSREPEPTDEEGDAA